MGENKANNAGRGLDDSSQNGKGNSGSGSNNTRKNNQNAKKKNGKGQMSTFKGLTPDMNGRVFKSIPNRKRRDSSKKR